VTSDKWNSCICKYLQVSRAQGQVQVQVLKPHGQSQGQARDHQGKGQVLHFCVLSTDQGQAQALTSLISGLRATR